MAITNFVAAGMLFIIGFILSTGKASFLIAGYNTMSPGQQARIDEKKMSRFLSKMLIYSAIALTIGGLFALIGVFPLVSVSASWGMFFVIIIGGIIYANVSKRFKIDVIQVDINNPSKRNILKQGLVIGIGLAIGLAITAFVFIGGSRPAAFALSDTELKISGMYGESIAVSDIQNVILQDSLPTGLVRTNGVAVGSVLKGNFASSGDNMKIFADTSAPPFIYLYTLTGELFIINYQDTSETISLYHKILTHIE